MRPTRQPRKANLLNRRNHHVAGVCRLTGPHLEDRPWHVAAIQKLPGVWAVQPVTARPNQSQFEPPESVAARRRIMERSFKRVGGRAL